MTSLTLPVQFREAVELRLEGTLMQAVEHAPDARLFSQETQVLRVHRVDVALGGERAHGLLGAHHGRPQARLAARSRRQVERAGGDLEDHLQHPVRLVAVVDHRRPLRPGPRRARGPRRSVRWAARVRRSLRVRRLAWPATVLAVTAGRAATAARCTSLSGTPAAMASDRQSSYSGVACITSPL